MSRDFLDTQMLTQPTPAFRSAMEAMLDVLPDPVFVKDREHRWVILNEAACQFLGRPRQWLYGKSDYDISPREEAEVFWKKDDEVFAGGQSNVNVELHTDERGMRRIIETKKTLFKDPQGVVFLLGVIRDLTELTQAKTQLEQINRGLEFTIEERTEELRSSNAQLRSLAFYDPLTGLPNRRLLLDTVNGLLVDGEVGVFFIDLDHFKWMNDSKGHPFGDEILRSVSRRFQTLEGFDLLSRLGGDEFVAIARFDPSSGETQLAELARVILDAMTVPLDIQDQEWVMNASIGIAVSPRDGRTSTELIQHADTAMYRAKDRGRNQYAFFDQELGSRATEYVTLETGLRAAIRNHTLGVALQPIFDGTDLKIIGYEALARWSDPLLGDIAPDRFIPIAEVSGLIYELGLVVMERALTFAPRQRREDGAPLRLAINLSARQLSRASLAGDVQRLLDTTGFPANQLEFEITESSATNLSEETRVNLVALRALNVSIALDDFGTGYSSLTHLQRLPIDRVKIDRGFVADVPQNARTATLVEAMIRMTQALDLKVVAEGVERMDQLEFLTKLGCDEIQGFLLGVPELLK